MVKISRSYLLLGLIFVFSFVYRIFLMLRDTFPPGSDIGPHNGIVHSITQSGGTNFLWNNYHMGGGFSGNFPGYHIFVAYVIALTGMTDYTAHALVASFFSALIVVVAFLLMRSVWNVSSALIVAFLVAVSRFDVEMLMWGGYPNIVALMLIPLAFFLLLEKKRFSNVTFLTVTTLVCAAIFMTHTLSAVLFVAIIGVTLVLSIAFSKRTNESRVSLLVWFIPLILGGLIVSPLLIQFVPAFLNANGSTLTGGSAVAIQQAFLSTRVVPLEFVVPLLICVFLWFLFSKHYQGRFLSVPTILLVSWWLVPATLTQMYLVGVYTDYLRFIYFLILPVIMMIGLGFFHAAHFFADALNWVITRAKILPQVEQKMRRIPSSLARHVTKGNFTDTFILVFTLIAFFGVPLFVTPAQGVAIQSYYQVVNQPEYDASQWALKNTPTNAIFAADADYGWWFSGFALRPTISGADPQYLSNSRELRLATAVNSLLDTDYLVDNGLIQVREDGGYIARHNPEFLAKINGSDFPYPFFNFENSEIVVTLRNGGNVQIVKLSEVPVEDMHVENSSQSVSIYVTWGNDLFNFTQETTVSEGVSFAKMTETLQTNNPAVSFDTLNFILHSKGAFVQGNNNETVGLVDANMQLAGQLIFTDGQPVVTRLTKDNLAGLGILYNLDAKPETKLTFFAGVYQYQEKTSYATSQAKTAYYQEVIDNHAKTYFTKVANLPLTFFDYRQAIQNIGISYVVVRDFQQIPRFAKDPLFSLVYRNDAVAIFQVENRTIEN